MNISAGFVQYSRLQITANSLMTNKTVYTFQTFILQVMAATAKWRVAYSNVGGMVNQ